ncbi:MAG: COQ9 family protein [Parvularculaceae bacterium]|nr:COQ9 family protein [Parvularculaceae bacterium]
MTDHADFTAQDENLRRDILDALLAEAAFDGFTDTSLEAAAKGAGVPAGQLQQGLLERLFPRGISDVLTYWSMEEDRAMVEAFDALNPTPHGITKKITWLIRQRIEQLDWNREAARRAATTLALPIHGTLGAQLIWKTADRMWRTIDDQSTDFNFYTKRASLSAIYTSTLGRWMADQGDAAADEPYAETWAFLDDRIGNLMQFEKAKGQIQKALPNPSDLVGFLGKLRYGRGQ